MSRRVRLLCLAVCLSLPILGMTACPAQAQGLKDEVLQAAQSTGTGTAMRVEGFSWLLVGIIGTAGADRVVTFQGSQDGTNYAGMQCVPLTTGTAALTITASGVTPLLVRCQIDGLKLFRAALSGGTTGTVTVTASALGLQ